MIEIGTNYWDSETCRKIKKINLLLCNKCMGSHIKLMQSVFYAKQFKEDLNTKKSFQIEKIGKVGLIALQENGRELLI